MAAKDDRLASIKLTKFDDLFTTDEGRADSQRERVLDIPLAEISDFLGHPFKVRADEAMLEMADSIKQYGVLVPGLVRPKEGGGYEMVSGHRRKKASELAGMETIPCLVRELDDDQATIIMVDSVRP
ncbi:parB-like partition protein [Paenibacillus sp. FSL H8-237]|uniref:ParB N-terminal domain-containing protein n=1 Tax=Paenibacillus TaxID=44249 RepID=UPI0003E28FC5|nr:parB-like partition protein [Paenibacillus sp. FSL H8-237]SIR49572.1 ParB/RepB/Spo0J family partition protein [Paenibacillus sp. RU4X]SIR58665.1 ParB/RepB/Spo0J family partition protein [Paenibacillus sp. RU4T]